MVNLNLSEAEKKCISIGSGAEVTHGGTLPQAFGKLLSERG